MIFDLMVIVNYTRLLYLRDWKLWDFFIQKMMILFDFNPIDIRSMVYITYFILL